MRRVCHVFWLVVVLGVMVWPGGARGQTILLDANLSAGFQGLDGLVDVQPGQRISLEVYAKDIAGANGFAVQIAYDASQLQFEGFKAGTLIPNFTGLNVAPSAGVVEIGGASVAGAAGAAQGRLGVVSFQVLSGFTGNVSVSLSQGRIVKGGVSEAIDTAAQVVVGLPVSGPVMIDGDAAAGLQAARRVVDVNVGDAVDIEVYGRGISGASGFSAILEYDSSQLSFEGFTATEIIPGFTGLQLNASGAVEIGGASVTGTAGAAEGRLGVLRFRVMPGFSGEATIELVGGRLTLGTDATNYTSDLIVTVSGIAGGGIKTPDFNGNGTVDFPDFLLFAGAFGKRIGEDGYSSSLDLDDSGAIDFPDFLQFAQQFGKSVGG